MKNLLAFGLAAWFFLVLPGRAHTSDSPGSMPKHQETSAAQTNRTQQEVATEQTTGAPAPVVELSETVFDFGKVSETSDYVHVFKVRNIGTGVLEIRKVMPG